jgi:hypothetical protein
VTKFPSYTDFGIGCHVHQPSLTHGKAEFEKVPTPGRPAKEVGPARPTLAQLGPGFVPCVPHVILSVTVPYFGHIEDMHGFWYR